MDENKMISEFKVKIFYAPTPDLIKEAADRGYTHVVVHSIGHVRRTVQGAALESVGDRAEWGDDIPLFFEKYPRIAEERKKVAEKEIKRLQERIKEKIELAVSLNLKPLFSCYEISLPYELKRCYPDLYPERGKFCLANEDHKLFIEDKYSELFETFSGLAGCVFSPKEASEGQYYAHECGLCKDLPMHERLNLLADAVLQGKNRVRPEAEIIYRMWGLEFPVEFYKNRLRTMWEWFGKPEEYADLLGKGPLINYDPENVLPKFSEICDPSIIICSKATWQDFDLKQAVNPFVGRFVKQREIIEISYENFANLSRKYFLLSSQMDRFVKLALEKEIEGVMALPCAFGFNEVWKDEEARFGSFCGGGYKESFMPYAKEFCIGDFTGALISKLLQSPESGLRETLSECIEEKFGETHKDALAEILISMEDFGDRVFNCRGFSLASPNHYINNCSLQLEAYKEHISWSSCAVENGKEKVLAMLKDLPGLFSEKDEVLQDAKVLLKRFEALKNDLTLPTSGFFEKALMGFEELLKIHVLSQKTALTMWALERGDIKMEEKTLCFVLDCVREKEKLLLNGRIADDMKDASKEDRLYGFKGIQRRKKL